MKSMLVICLGILALSSSALAHHAMEYIEIESYTTTRRGEFLFHLHYDYMVDDSDNPDADHWEFTPGIAYGFTDRLMFDIHTHFAKFGQEHVVEEKRDDFEPSGPSPFMEAVAATLQYRLTENWPINIGISGTIEIPLSRAEELLGSEDNVYEGKLILSRDFAEHSNITINISYEEEGSENSTGWALGAKTPISADPHGIAGGIEIFGDFDRTTWSIMPGIYAPLSDGIVIKSGLEFGQTEDEEGNWAGSLRASMALMYKF